LRSVVRETLMEVMASKEIHTTVAMALVTTLVADLGGVWEGIWKGIEYSLKGNELVDAVAELIFLVNSSVCGSLAKLRWKYRIEWGRGGPCTGASPAVKDCDACSRSSDGSRLVSVVYGLCWEPSVAEPDYWAEPDYEL
jgi:hypothetical protein